MEIEKFCSGKQCTANWQSYYTELLRWW